MPGTTWAAAAPAGSPIDLRGGGERDLHVPADAEGSEMGKLRREMHRRMLGNGYCARPAEMGCHFEWICESCTFFPGAATR